MSCSCRLVQWGEGLVHVQESPFQEADPARQGGAGISNDQESAPGVEIADLVTGAQHVTGRTTAGTARPRDIHTIKPPQPKFQKTNLQGHMSERSDIRSIPTPIRIHQLSQYLTGYNAKKVRFLMSGFTQGFRLQYQGERLFRDAKNLKSAYDLPEVLRIEIAKELQAGRIGGPFISPPFPQLQISPLGLIAKKEAGAYRLIHHLSFPEGESINDGISADDSHVQYQSIDDAIKYIRSMGVGSLMAKTDIEKAFRILPVHPDDYELLGMKVNKLFYYDKALPMGCSISCRLFEDFSTAIHWVLSNKLAIPAVVHVLDDFLFIGSPATQECMHSLQSFLTLCENINIPIKHTKTVYPSTVICFLGIELDSIQMESRLPLDKVDKIKLLLNTFLERQKVTLKEMQSLIGTLNFACRVVSPGRPFLRRLIDLTRGLQKPHHHLRLTQAAKADLSAWKVFIDSFNGTYMFSSMIWENSEQLHFYTDASGVGFGAIFGKKWFFQEWAPLQRALQITIKELFPIVLAVEIWGGLLKNRCVIFHSDNSAAVAAINVQTSREPTVMRLIRRLVVVSLQLNIQFKAQHIPGKLNILADHLSRLQVAHFRRLAPHAERQPTLIPAHRLAI